MWSSKAFQERKRCLLLPALCLCDIWIVPNPFWVFVCKLWVQGWSENKVWIMVFLSKAMWYCVELKNLFSYRSALPEWRADGCWAWSSWYLIHGKGEALQCCWQSYNKIQGLEAEVRQIQPCNKMPVMSIKRFNNLLELILKKSLAFSFKISLQFLGEIIWPACELEDHSDPFWVCNWSTLVIFPSFVGLKENTFTRNALNNSHNTCRLGQM